MLTTLPINDYLLGFPEIAAKSWRQYARASQRLLSVLGLSLGSFCALAQTPFTCTDGKSYLFQGSPTDAYEIDLLAGTTRQVTYNGLVTGVNQKLNAFGYNPKDGCLWGFVFNTNQLVRVDSNYSTQLFSVQNTSGPGFGTGNDFVVGDIDKNGKMYFTRGGSIGANNTSITIREVDLNAAATSATLPWTSFTSTGGANINDWAVSPIDNNLYALDSSGKASGQALTLYRFNTTTGAREVLGTVSGGSTPIAAATFGAVFMDINGALYVVANETGLIHRIDQPDQLPASPTASIAATYVVTGPVATNTQNNNNDGARCATSIVRSSTPLPVTLVSFTATIAAGRRTLLRWVTASELNSRHFEVQHSLEGSTFTPIGQVTSQGTTSQATTYSFVDAAPGAGSTHYYRLRQVDLDGRSTFSPVQVVTLAPGASAWQLTAVPNPSTSDNLSLRVQYEGAVATPAVLTVYGLLGQAICTQTVVLQPGTTILTPAARLAPGAYWVALGENATSTTQRARVVIAN